MRHWSSLDASRQLAETTLQPDGLLTLGRLLVASGYRFTTVSPASHVRVNARPGNERAGDLAGIFGWSRPFEKNLIPADVFAAMQSADVLRCSDGLWRSKVRASTIDSDLFFHSPFPTTEPDAVFFG